MSQDVDELWRTISAPQPPWRAASVFPWMGLDTRVRPGRLARLEKSQLGARVAAALRDVDDATLARIAALAAINQRQAESGFRVTSIVNITVPAAWFGIIAQVFPDAFSEVLRNPRNDMLLAGLLLVVLVQAILLAVYAFHRSREAGDLSDLIAIVRARRARLDLAGAADATVSSLEGLED